MPVYNAETFLARSVGSVIDQTFKDWELILVDDCSKDSSGALCDEYASRDERIHVIHHGENQGTGKSRNDGVAEARGDYIGFMDNDDFMHPQMLEIFYNAICRNAADIIMCNPTQWPDDKSIEVLPIQQVPPNYTWLGSLECIKTLFSTDTDAWRLLAVWNKLYRADLAKSISFPDSGSEDIAFNFTVYRKTAGILYAETEPLYFWIQRKSSTWHGNGIFSLYRATVLQTKFNITKEAFEYCPEAYQYAAIDNYKRILSLRYDSINSPFYETVMGIIKQNFAQFNRHFMQCKDIRIIDKAIMTIFYYMPGLYAAFRRWKEWKALHPGK